MKQVGSRILVLMTALLWMTSEANADNRSRQDGQNPNSAFMRVFGQALPPIGHVSFCRRHPSECRAKGASAKRVTLTPDLVHELRSVNRIVNQMVRPVTDLKLYGRLEHWTYPANSGDCEDYVLLKRRLLIERGWPESALLITVVRDENDEGHAVLTARTADGDFLLDNKRSEIVSWSKSPYVLVKRQSYRNPRLWMSLVPSNRRSEQRVSGTRSK